MLKGVDIGGTFVKVLWEDGRREKHRIFDFKNNRDLLLEKLREVILNGHPSGVGIAVAGFTSRSGVISHSPNIPVLNGLDLRKLLAGMDIPFVAGNDVSIGAFGEWYYDYRDSEILVLVAVGTGLGGGLVVGGKPFFGVSGTAMEIGHHTVLMDGRRCSCGRRGCWEAYCSSYGLSETYGKLGGEPLKDYQIIERAREGEETARRAVVEFKKFLIRGLMNLVHILNPDQIVLGGGVIEGMKELLGDIEKDLKNVVEDLPAGDVKVGYSTAGEFMGARGALAFIKSRTADNTF